MNKPDTMVDSMILDLPIPSAWWFTSNTKLHWQAKSRKTRSLRALARVEGKRVMGAARKRRPAFTKCKLAVKVFPAREHFDPTNAAPMVKAIVDGLTDAGWWEDDDHDHIPEMTYIFGRAVNAPNRHITIIAEAIQ